MQGIEDGEEYFRKEKQTKLSYCISHGSAKKQNQEKMQGRDNVAV